LLSFEQATSRLLSPLRYEQQSAGVLHQGVSQKITSEFPEIHLGEAQQCR